ncbi:MAG: class I adenylate-forming enzyme family protein [Candidatus Acidiferrales bacterium]
MPRTELPADPAGKFLHGVILDACRRFASRTALVDASCEPARRMTYAELGEMIERLARGFVAAGIRPGEVVALYLPNSWEFCAAYHAATLAGAIPTPLNPAYREREVRFQLENSGAVLLISDGRLLEGISLASLPALRRVFTTRQSGAVGDEPLQSRLAATNARLPEPSNPPEETLAALPFSSGTTGLPKGVMLTHANVVVNVFQSQPAGEEGFFGTEDVVLCFLPLYHIYGLNVIMNAALAFGGTLVLLPRYDTARVLETSAREGVTCLPVVPPVLNAFCQAAEAGAFPRRHRLKWIMSGAAPLAPQLINRFASLTGLPLRQGYGMTEASPVTHLGFLDAARYRPESIGHPVALTECRIVDTDGREVAPGERGELVMRGPQFMRGYWNAPEATAAALRDGWYWSGDVACCDAGGFYFIVDRLKELIKYKGFAVAPAEVEAVLIQHPAVRDCGVVGKPDDCAGEIPCAFVVLRDSQQPSPALTEELCAFVAERLSSYKQPREVRFVASLPRTPSGKILRRDLRSQL